MRSGTRKVADAKPDAPTTTKESDTIPMTDIGKIRDKFSSSLSSFKPSGILCKFPSSTFFDSFVFLLRIEFSFLKVTGTEIITEDQDDEEDQDGVGFCEQVAMAAGSIGSFIYKNR